MQQRKNRANRKLPFKLEPDVKQHTEYGQHDSENALLGQFAGNLGADNFNAAILNIRAQGRLQFRDGGLLGFVAAGLGAQCGLEHRAASQIPAIQYRPNRGRPAYSRKPINVGRLGGADGDDSAALEIHANIEANEDECQQGRKAKQARYKKAKAAQCA